MKWIIPYSRAVGMMNLLVWLQRTLKNTHVSAWT